MSVTFRIENERQGVFALAGAHPGSLPSSGAPPGPHHLATMRPEWQRPTAASRYGHRTWSGPGCLPDLCDCRLRGAFEQVIRCAQPGPQHLFISAGDDATRVGDPCTRPHPLIEEDQRSPLRHALERG